jgi:acetylornithine/succinyldiaminopimelate/putrescine aminotransferase
MRKGLDAIQDRYAYLSDIRQLGIIFGLGFDDEAGGLKMARALYRTGLWAMFAGFDRRYLQFKLGLLVDAAYCDEALEKLEAALKATTP